MSKDIEIIDNTDKFKKDMENAIEIALEKIGGHIESEAIRELENTPRRVDTGRLRNSITHVVGDDEVAIGTNVEYAIYVHEGTGKHAENGKGRKDTWVYQDDKGNWHTTSGMPANRFLRNAVERNQDQIERVLTEEIKKYFQ